MSWITARIFCVILCFLQFATVKVGLCGLFGTESEIHCRSNIRTTEISRPETIYIPFGFRYWTIQWMVTKQALEASQYMQFRRMSGVPCKAFDRCRRQVFRIIGVLSTREITLRSGGFPRLMLLPLIFSRSSVDVAA